MPSFALIAVILAGTLFFSSSQTPTRLVAVSNVRLRTAPLQDAAIVASVPLGTALVELETGGESGGWVRVRLPMGTDGWMPSRLTRRFDATTEWQVIDALARERLARRGDSFPARVELVRFLERARADARDPEVSGRLAVHWLDAMTLAFAAIPASHAHAAGYAPFLDARRAAIVYNEPGGRWMVKPEAILALHAAERDTSAADDIAWFLTRNGLPGECEGFIPCYVRRANLLEGEYLRRHSAGRYAADAVSRIAASAALWAAGGSYFYDRGRDCGELGAAIGPLRDAIAQTRTESRGAAIASLDRLGCR